MKHVCVVLWLRATAHGWPSLTPDGVSAKGCRELDDSDGGEVLRE